MKSFLLVVTLCTFCMLQSAAKIYYVQSHDPVNWFGAFEKCASLNLQMATVNSWEEQQQLEGAIKNSDQVWWPRWISANDLASEGNYVWMSTGQPLDYTHWAENEPNNEDGRQQCVRAWPNATIDSFAWDVIACDYLHNVVCETKP